MARILISALIARILIAALLFAVALQAQVAPRPPGAPAPTGAASAGHAPSFEQLAKRAEAARNAERLDEAVTLYRKALGMRPEWTEGWWYLATILYDRDNYPEARDAFRRYVALDPRSGPGQVLFGLCLFQTGEYEMAVAAFSRADELKFGGSDQFRQIANYHLGMTLTKLGRFEPALAVFNKFARRGIDKFEIVYASGVAALRMPLLPSEVPEGKRELVSAVGHAAFQVGAQHTAAAEKEFRDVAAKYPNEPNVHYVFGTFLLLINNLEEGLQQLIQELRISPDHVPCLTQIAIEYLRRGEAEKAEPYARRCLKLDPNSFISHSTLGRVLVELDKLDEGIKDLETARRLAPDSPQTRFALGTAYRRIGRADEALKEMAEFERLKKIVDEQKKESQ